MWVETSLLETSLLEIRAEVAETFSATITFPGKFLYIENIKNTLKSCHCTASLAILI